MPTFLTPQAFVAKWRDTTLKERAAAQEHFIDLCRLVGHPTPAEDDPTGERFTFEAGADKQGGGQGWADVWKRNYFAWEYKGKHANLDKAYQQLLQYRESLLNPPLLVVCDIDRILIHTNFTNTVKRVVEIGLDDLLTAEGMRALRAIFYEPEAFRAAQTTEQVTQEAATEFARLAEHLRKWGHEPERIAHFLIRLLFCLFAEDIELLPNGLFTRLVEKGRLQPDAFNRQLRQLFGAMAVGDFFGEHLVSHFNGGLFDDDRTVELDRDGLGILHRVASLDWSSIEPSILGTLFERSLDPAKRSQLGAHYTSREDILLLIEPVLMAPLRREWEGVQAKATDLAQRRDETSDAGTRTRRHNELRALIQRFFDQIAATRVLDPACGSGNFLYVALRQMLDLEKEVSQFASTVGLPGLFPQSSPAQLYGIELNEYAHELAQATVWIGYIQWLHENGYGVPSEPILKRLDNIRQMDAILAFDAEGKPFEPEWPEAEVIVGNPPFLGDKLMKSRLDINYVESLRTRYSGRVPGGADLVTYWFERARELIELGKIKRVGLLATQAIRGGANRVVLDNVAKTGRIFWAISDRNWILNGATVHVSMVGFDDGKSDVSFELDGQAVEKINPDLTSEADTTLAQALLENENLAFIGTQKGGKFDIIPELAQAMLRSAGNPNGRPNSDVIKPWFNGIDITQRPRGMFIIDFGVDRALDTAAEYMTPFEYVKEAVKPQKEETNSEPRATARWWLHQRSRPEMRAALQGLSRYIATPRVAKHRVFVWKDVSHLADSQVVVIASQSDYLFGVLHSRIHEVWARKTGTQLREAESGFRYSQTMTFETFPFPWPPGQEPTGDARVEAIAEAAQELVAKRDAWLNPPGMSDAELKKRTLTNLYNLRPTWLDLAHKKLDKAVFDAYGWPHDLSDEEILARLLALNLARAGMAGEGEKAHAEPQSTQSRRE
ncbi:MAG: class I SAM-dependent DNA methyltransferase [Caldilineaceae bacterium]|nr:class I SAM-dependent DNA methyltransferase [Caldilineaceae bacterium]